MSEKYPKGGTMNQWSETCKRSGQLGLADSFGDDKLKGINALDVLNLPGPVGTMVSARQYLDNPGAYFDAVGTDEVYINVIPSREGLIKLSRFGISKTEAEVEIEELLSTLPSELVDEYSVGVYEYNTNLYGGSVSVSPNGYVLMEFGEGSCQEYTRGSSVPHFSMDRDMVSGRFKYSFPDEELREATWRIMQFIPHSTEAVHMGFLQGYYEFAVYRSQRDNTLQPIFLDYKDNPAYYYLDEVALLG
jgi:hypothetical protein